MNRLPFEIQNLIYSYMGVAPSAKLINELIELKNMETDELEFDAWYKLAKPAFAYAFNDYTSSARVRHYSRVKFAKVLRFNPTFYKCAVLEWGEPCVSCDCSRNWQELNTEGYEGMCEECYTNTYYPNQGYETD
jgi:hypothetical protein